MKIKNLLDRNITELSEISAAMNETQLAGVMNVCNNSKRIFFSGMGRSGNMVKALAIRFMHLGFGAYVAGDASTPSIAKGDTLIAVSSSAKTKQVLGHIEVAKKAGAKVVLISAQDQDPLSCDQYLCIPARTVVKSNQHAGSLFEQSVLIVGDAISEKIRLEKGITTQFMDNLHANLQ